MKRGMRTGVSERRLPMMHVQTSDPGGPAVPVQVDLSWAATAPWSVRVAFPMDGALVSWDIGLDLLTAGMVRPQPGIAQNGPMLVWNSGERCEATILGTKQATPTRAGWLQARTSDLAEFLADALRTMAIRTATA